MVFGKGWFYRVFQWYSLAEKKICSCQAQALSTYPHDDPSRYPDPF